MIQSNGKVTAKVPELYRRYRPRKFRDVVGQPEAVTVLEEMIRSDNVPHALLLSGSSGSGKTTLARIMASKLGCDKTYCKEINFAESRGIDIVRDIGEDSKAPPLVGENNVKYWILDECFPFDTRVSVPGGSLRIGEVREGDWVHNVGGKAKVKHVFKNKVSFDRIIKLHFDDGSSLITTSEHRFLTEFGWIEARHLNFDIPILAKVCYAVNAQSKEAFNVEENVRKSMYNLRSDFQATKVSEDMFWEMWLETQGGIVWRGLGEKVEVASDCIDMRFLWEGIRVEGEEQGSGMLFQNVCFSFVCEEEWIRGNGNSHVSSVWRRIRDESVKSKSLLQHVLCRKEEKQSARMEGEDGKVIQFGGMERAIKRENQKIAPNRKGKKIKAEKFGENEEKQSNAYAWNCGKGSRHKGEKWNFACLDGRTWRERQTYRTTIDVEGSLGREVGVGASYINGDTYADWVSYQLQGRYRQEKVQDSYRNRWESSSVEKGYIEGCKKDSKARRIRVVRIEVYQPGCNDSSFLGVIGDQEKGQGFAEFYDLEIEGHPSYFVEGIPVHNCHRATGDALSAALKLLEDPPDYVYYALCTTNPEKLPKTLRTRCTEIRLNPLVSESLEQIVRSVCIRESLTIPDEVVEKIVECSEGSARQALVLLGKIKGLPGTQEMLASIHRPEETRTAYELSKALVWEKGVRWRDIQKILSELKDADWEGLRHLVLHNAMQELLKPNGNAARAYLILDCFSEPFYNTGKPGLVKACYMVKSDSEKQ